MATVANKRSVMTLYSDPLDIYSHRVRVALAEKNVKVEIIDVNIADKPEDLLQLNPYNSTPTLVDRDLVIYESRIIMEYLDERFPHPPLMPVYPVQRAKNRQVMYRIDREMYTLFHEYQESKNDKEKARVRQRLQEIIMGLEPIFDQNPFFLAEEFSMVDCCLGVLLWRLPSLGIEIPLKNKGFYAYCSRLFDRVTFKESLSAAEIELSVKRKL